ncbi:hypothetical protein J2T21_000907 [Paeniglutamicibacter psychrophenolicus]|nr:hypothetical protein [Paeniglutamicibacter psychrophenolicus]
MEKLVPTNATTRISLPAGSCGTIPSMARYQSGWATRMLAMKVMPMSTTITSSAFSTIP